MNESFGEEIECVEVIDDDHQVEQQKSLPLADPSLPNPEDSQFITITIDENAENLTGDQLLQYFREQGLELVDAASQQVGPDHLSQDVM